MVTRPLLFGLTLAAMLAVPAVAREPVVQPLPADKDTPATQVEPPTADAPKPVTDKTVTAVDVVATPASDLNLKKDKIPVILLTAQDRPYDLTGLSNCARLTGAIGELDAVLGNDLDLPQTDGDSTSAGSIAQSVVGAFIPFRGVIRELSGANAHERRLQSAILAGAVRRGFLKGVGQQRGCAYPARAATQQVIAQRTAVTAEPAPKASKRKRGKRDKVQYVSAPVVQKTD